jgi:hypothetical protein
MNEWQNHRAELAQLIAQDQALAVLQDMFRCERRGLCLLDLWFDGQIGHEPCKCRARFDEWHVVPRQDDDAEDLPF